MIIEFKNGEIPDWIQMEVGKKDADGKPIQMTEVEMQNLLYARFTQQILKVGKLEKDMASLSSNFEIESKERVGNKRYLLDMLEIKMENARIRENRRENRIWICIALIATGVILNSVSSIIRFLTQ